MDNKKTNLSGVQKAFIGLGSSVLLFMILFMRTIPERYVPVRDYLLSENYGHKTALRDVIKSRYTSVSDKQLKNDWDFQEEIFDWGASCAAIFTVDKDKQLKWRGSEVGVQQCKQIKRWQPYNSLSEELYKEVTGFNVLSDVQFPVSIGQTPGELHIKVQEHFQNVNKVPDSVDSYKIRDNDMMVSYEWNPSGNGPKLSYGKMYAQSDYSIQYSSKSVAFYLNDLMFEDNFKDVALIYLNTIGRGPWEPLIGESLKKAIEFRKSVQGGVEHCGSEGMEDCNETFYVSPSKFGVPWWKGAFEVVYHKHPATESVSSGEYIKIEFKRP